MICNSRYLSIGAGGDGPAIRIDDDLLNGHSYRSKTYENE